MKHIFISILILSGIASYAGTHKWTLEECMRYAVDNSLQTKKQEAQNKIYQQDYLEAIGRLLPGVSASAGTAWSFGRSVDSETNTYTNINQFYNSYSLSSSLTLFNGFTNVTRVRLQKVNKLMGKEQLEQVKDFTAYETMQAFINVLYCTEMVGLAESRLQQSSANLKQAERMEELGVKGRADVAEMAAQEALDNFQLTQQRNALAIAAIQLKQKMNFPVDEELEIAGDTTSDIIIRSVEPALDIFEQSGTFLPKATAAGLSLQSQELAWKAAKRYYFPSLTARGGYDTQYFRYLDGKTYTSFGDQLKNNRGQYLQAVLSVPLFSGFSRSANSQRYKAQLEIVRAERDRILRELYAEIEQAVTDMNGQTDEYHSAKKQVEAMQLAYDINQRKYAEGLISALELNTSANRLMEAKAAELNAKLKYKITSRLVDYYKGKPFI